MVSIPEGWCCVTDAKGGGVVGRRNRPTVSEPEGNERGDLPSRNLQSDFRKPFGGGLGWVRVRPEGEPGTW